MPASKQKTTGCKAQCAEDWESHICELFIDLSLERNGENKFVGRTKTTRIGDLQFTNICAGGQIVRRGAREIKRQGSDQFFLILQSSGQCTVFSESSRAVAMLPGDAVLVNPQIPYILNFEQPADQICIEIPSEDVFHNFGKCSNIAIGRKIDRGNPVSRVLAASVSDLAENASSPDGEIEASIELFYDVLAGCLKRITNGQALQSGDQRLTTFNSLIGFIVKNHNQDDLSPSDAAGELGMSVRNLSRLCCEQGTTFSKLVLNSRLTAAAHALRQHGEHSHGVVTHVAFEHGFSDLSHFSKSFKAKYGVSPANFVKIRA